MSTMTKCAECGSEFLAKRLGQRFCCANHRYNFHNKNIYEQIKRVHASSEENLSEENEQLKNRIDALLDEMENKKEIIRRQVEKISELGDDILDKNEIIKIQIEKLQEYEKLIEDFKISRTPRGVTNKKSSLSRHMPASCPFFEKELVTILKYIHPDKNNSSLDALQITQIVSSIKTHYYPNA